MLLRASGQAIDQDVELSGAVGEVGADADGGVPHGAALIRYAEAATRGDDDLDPARQALIEAVGGAGLIEAAATVGIFNGLVRVADSTGVPLDEGTRERSEHFRKTLGLNAYGGSRNTDLERPGSTGAEAPVAPGAPGAPGANAMGLFMKGE